MRMTLILAAFMLASAAAAEDREVSNWVDMMGAIYGLVDLGEKKTYDCVTPQPLPPEPVEAELGCKCSSHPKNNLGSELHDAPYQPEKGTK